jgi:hypothetical protein
MAAGMLKLQTYYYAAFQTFFSECSLEKKLTALALEARKENLTTTASLKIKI